MTRQTHDIVNDHFGVLEEDQIASGTPGIGKVPVGTGTGTAAWGDAGGLSDLVTGNDQTFAASLGNWTNSGGTMTRDTGYVMDTLTASLKFAVTTSGQYVSLPVSGTFLANTDYWAVLWISNESTSSSFAANLSFGLFGTDVETRLVSLAMATGLPYVGNGNFVAVGLHWRPTADRTGVTLRLETNTAASTTWHIGMARAWKTPLVGPIRVGNSIYMPMNQTTPRMRLSPAATGTSDGLNIQANGITWIDAGSSSLGLFLDPTADYFQLYVEHAAADKPQQGLDIEVGEDYLGFFIGQKDANTIQFYGDYGDYDFEFEDGSTGTWASVSGTGVRKAFAAMEARTASGSATVASGSTSITVTHGAGYTPGAADITVTPTNNPTNDPGWFWISSVGATTFDINVRSDPGAGGATFAWRCDR